MADEGKTPSTPPPRKQNFVDKYGNTFSNTLSSVFFHIGAFVGKLPIPTLGISLLFVAVCSLGLMELIRVGEETRSDKLWVPANTQAQKDKTFVVNNYEQTSRFENVLMILDTAKDDAPEGILQPKYFDAVYRTLEKLKSVNATYNGTELKIEDLCFKRANECVYSNILEGFSPMKNSSWDTKEKIMEVVQKNTMTSNTTGSRMDIEAVLGGLTKDNGVITGATVVSLDFLLNNVEEKGSDGEFRDERAEAWEQEWLDQVEELEEENITFSWFSFRSFADEFGTAIQGDIQLLQIAILCNIIFANIQLTQWNMGCRGNRVHVVIAGIVAVGLAVMSAYGVCAGIGITFSPLMNVLPFLMLGIGVDDMFVIVNSFDRTPESAPISQRVAVALSHAGPSITLTSLTDFAAFMIGSLTSLPALAAFCQYAAVGVVLCFILQVGFFTSILALDASLKKGENCCRCRDPCSENKCCLGLTVTTKNNQENFVRKYVAEPMRSLHVKMGVLLVFTALTVCGIYGCTQIQVQADVNDFIPAGSYLKDWFNARDRYFISVGDDVNVYIKSDVDYSQPETWNQMKELFDAFKGADMVAEDTVQSWFEELREYKLDRLDQATFYADLRGFLDGRGGRFTKDIKFADDNTTILSSRMTGNHVKVTSSNDLVATMDNLRAAVAATSMKDHAFAFGSEYLQYEQYKAIEKEAAVNLSSCMVAVTVVVFLMIVNPIASSLVVFSVALAVLDVVGFMYFWDLNIDSVTVIMLVIALGLSVDYSAHLGHTFMHKQGTNDDRMVETMADIGVAVFNGAMSTFMAVVVIGGSNSYVFITFFRQLFLCTLFGVSHGLLLLPVMLALFGPPAFDTHPHVYTFDDAVKSTLDGTALA